MCHLALLLLVGRRRPRARDSIAANAPLRAACASSYARAASSCVVIPALRLLADLGDGHIRVAVRQTGRRLRGLGRRLDLGVASASAAASVSATVGLDGSLGLGLGRLDLGLDGASVSGFALARFLPAPIVTSMRDVAARKPLWRL